MTNKEILASIHESLQDAIFQVFDGAQSVMIEIGTINESRNVCVFVVTKDLQAKIMKLLDQDGKRLSPEIKHFQDPLAN